MLAEEERTDILWTLVLRIVWFPLDTRSRDQVLTDRNSILPVVWLLLTEPVSDQWPDFIPLTPPERIPLTINLEFSLVRGQSYT
jgi:hypothetical protein